MIRTLTCIILLVVASKPSFAIEQEQEIRDLQRQEINLSVLTSMGFNFDSKFPENAIIFEPILSYEIDDHYNLSLYTAMYRPTDPYQEPLLPKAQITLSRKVPWIRNHLSHVRLTTEIDNVTDWDKDGYQAKGIASFESRRYLNDYFSMSFSLSLFAMASHNRVRTDGSTIPKLGVTERLEINYDLSKLQLGAAILQQQANGLGWTNDLAVEGFISYLLDPHVNVGLNYAMASTVTDDAMSLYRPAYSSSMGHHHRLSASLEVIF